MKRSARWILSFTVATALFLMLWDFTPQVASKSGDLTKAVRYKAVVRAKSSPATKQQGQEPQAPPQRKVLTETEESDDPDVPPFLSGKIDKQTYLQMRAEHIDMLRAGDRGRAG